MERWAHPGTEHSIVANRHWRYSLRRGPPFTVAIDRAPHTMFPHDHGSESMDYSTRRHTTMCTGKGPHVLLVVYVGARTLVSQYKCILKYFYPKIQILVKEQDNRDHVTFCPRSR